MTMQEMQDAVREVADAVGGNVRESYSGRGMYGKTCMGIVCDDPTEAIEEGAYLGLRGSQQDNMGTKFIVYWPSVEADE